MQFGKGRAILTSTAGRTRLEWFSAWARRSTARSRTIALSFLMLSVAAALGGYISGWRPPASPLAVPWWLLLPAVVCAEALVFHLELRGEAHTFTVSEIPLVIGFFFAPAYIVVLMRVVGSTAFQIFRRRQLGLKLTFNVANFAMDACITVTLLHLLVGSRRPDSTTTWLLVVSAVVVTATVTMACVSTVIYWHDGRPRLQQVMTTTVITAVMNTSLALLASDLLWYTPAALAILGIVLVVTFTAYRAHFNLAKRYASLQLLYDFTKVVSGSMRAEAVLDEILGKARQLLKAERAEALLFDTATGSPILRRRSSEAGADEHAALVPADVLRTIRHKVSDRNDAVVVLPSTRSDELQSLRDRLGVRDLLLASLRSEEGVVGAILVANRLGQVSTFEDEDCRLFETLANHASVAIDNSRLVQQLRQEADERRHEAEERRYQALHDALTGLPNRSHFMQQVEEVRLRGEHAAVMLMDLDRFKDVNDTLGHHHGDLLLSQVASRLIVAVGDPEMTARLGGDEFAVVVPLATGRPSAEDAARRVLDMFDQRFVIGDLTLDVRASVGLAVAPHDGSDAATLLQKADVAMYEAKAARSGMARYSAERDPHTPRRLALAGELRQAIGNGDILVYFQPKARLDDGQVVAAEALVRWRHPEMGMVYPDEFIPIAEQTGVEPQLTTYVLRAALRECASWHRAGYQIGVAINLAVRSLLDSRLPKSVTEVIAESGIPPGYLTLEITESSVMADPDRTIAVLHQLAAMGLRLSVDDFGTGYSSLSYLQRLPVHEVKADKSFVFRMASNVDDAIIVDSIIELGHKLGLSVVAEGVEDRLTWNRLRSLRCDVGQGYYLSKPIPAEAMSRWLEERRAVKADSPGYSIAVA